MTSAVPALPNDPLPGNPAADCSPRQLRLSIAHLMLWTLGTAIALALSRPNLDGQSASGSDAAARYETFYKLWSLLLIPFGGASIAALIFWAGHWVRGGRLFPVQPGHWLLITYGISYPLWAIANLLVYAAFKSAEYGGGDEILWAYAFVSLAMAFIQLLPLIVLRDRPRWRIFFVVEAILSVGQTVNIVLAALAFASISSRGTMYWYLSWTGLVATSIVFIGSLTLAVTLMLELAARPNRDYLHWTGCLTQVILACNNTAYFVFYFIL